ncbi:MULTISPECIES: hypothetical protein [unclassified Polaromonas]|jgi:hypothetical protein|uniref:major capsid protein n=1 Tax=unclassified Polaromonas TaxID=2638319 RepID=UPI000BD6BB31|nr:MULTISPECIES: hypothetical protein [unclassified Polaromonas]OYY34589.1 MAG: hypothetical protein B7Y60_16040 [Polaromonas sp. 35-63-35]OYZ15078.1 MAG: hypothetical protein B7Y28_22680 [Polaromonas sp. 16-63-31]OYZ78851.1 MAG: hypothetical protein B7Y09_11250 [Polaromonas sp. 24-63-21]OZA49635.1 MAG: hypothetical protein B7X88_14580 [Polaromonas sp. 17-63-33]OZA86821.1 MAG: hypothetical protein B7X65_15240 [Polaromonas sp. 39-63-25]
MGRLSNIRMVDPVLTNLALGYSNAEYVGQHLMPFVPVDKEANKLPKFGKEAFKIYSTERALRAKSNRINPEGITLVDLNTDEHDLEYPIDYREDAEAAFPLQAHATNVSTGGIALRREKMIADLAQNPANYAASNKIALSGTSQFTHASSDPVNVIEDGKEAVRAKIGKRPNTMIIGASALKPLKFHPALLDKIKYTQMGAIRLAQLRELFEIENIYVGEAVYSSDADVFGDIWSDSIVLAYVPTHQSSVERNLMEPSYGYTPRRKGNPLVDVRTEDGKIEVVRATDNFRPYMVAAEAGYLITDTNL